MWLTVRTLTKEDLGGALVHAAGYMPLAKAEETWCGINIIGTLSALSKEIISKNKKNEKTWNGKRLVEINDDE